MIHKDLINRLIDKKCITSEKVADKAAAYNNLCDFDKESALYKGKRIVELIIDSLFKNNDISHVKAENVCNRIKTLTDNNVIPKTQKVNFQYFCETLCPILKDPVPVLDDALSEHIELCSSAINRILNWYLQEILSRNTGEIKFIRGSAITKEMLRQAILLDKRVFKEDGWVDFDVCWGWLQNNSDIYIMGIDTETDRVVSYWNIMPISNTCFDTIKSGKFYDKLIPETEIENYDVPGYYKLYFCSIVIDPELRNRLDFFNKMLDAFGEKLLELYSKGIYFTDVIADGFTPSGKKMCELFGMKPVKTTSHDTTVYEVKLIPPNFNDKIPRTAFKRLYKLYKDIEPEEKMEPMKFKLGVTFTGTHRSRVSSIVDALLNHGFSKDDIFYDDWHDALINGIDADIKLQNIYAYHCDCVVVFLAKDYNTRTWTRGVEWRAIRILINTIKGKRICLLNVDSVDINEIEGLSYSTDIAKKIESLSAEEVAEFIRKRYDLVTVNTVRIRKAVKARTPGLA